MAAFSAVDVIFFFLILILCRDEIFPLCSVNSSQSDITLVSISINEIFTMDRIFFAWHIFSRTVN